MKPVRFLFYIFVSFFVPDRAQRLIAFPWFWTLTNGNIALIYSVTICEQKTKDQPPPPQALRFSHGLGKRRARNASDWWRRARDQGKGKEGRFSVRFSAVSPVSPSRLLLRANFHRERDVWVRGGQRIVNGQGASNMNYSLVTFNCDVWQIS